MKESEIIQDVIAQTWAVAMQVVHMDEDKSTEFIKSELAKIGAQALVRLTNE